MEPPQLRAAMPEPERTATSQAPEWAPTRVAVPPACERPARQSARPADPGPQARRPPASAGRASHSEPSADRARRGWQAPACAAPSRHSAPPPHPRRQMRHAPACAAPARHSARPADRRPRRHYAPACAAAARDSARPAGRRLQLRQAPAEMRQRPPDPRRHPPRALHSARALGPRTRTAPAAMCEVPTPVAVRATACGAWSAIGQVVRCGPAARRVRRARHRCSPGRSLAPRSGRAGRRVRGAAGPAAQERPAAARAQRREWQAAAGPTRLAAAGEAPGRTAVLARAAASRPGCRRGGRRRLRAVASARPAPGAPHPARR
jgi:hypothetical protein